jgi:hypothetical protein
VAGRFLDGKMQCLCPESDEVRVLLALVDDRQPEALVKGTLSGTVDGGVPLLAVEPFPPRRIRNFLWLAPQSCSDVQNCFVRSCPLD